MGLGKLPAELVEAVVTELCIHCSPGVERCCYNSNCYCANMDPADVERIHALTGLCLTSRHLNSIATRHLYHAIDSRCWLLLGRTRVARPDLALLARTMRNCWSYGTDQRSCPTMQDLYAYFSSKRATYLETVSEELSEEDWPQESLKGRVDDDAFWAGDNNLPLDILTSLCPNLEALDVSVSYFHAFRFCTPNSLPHLKHVIIAHADTTYGIDLSNIFPLLRAAPNLTRAVFWSVDACGELDVTLPKLTYLHLQNTSISVESLVNILRACPNLETFHYTMGVGERHDQFPLSAVRAAFLENAPNLKVLTLGAGENDHCDEDWDEDEAPRLARVFEEREVKFEFKPYDW
ncbi:hypothetical protein C8A01DRAFT_20123 [Parachaetomium inaequale]|uniref:F-box domain-containing protein n=1 Tax=Parachaetomium inaequale TaxID=2588326 RepID=A0AAN6P9R6_9PEZI|nr:hypothetical protein C8A01DRAFT_20123 [Parachaetomium inaequale]